MAGVVKQTQGVPVRCQALGKENCPILHLGEVRVQAQVDLEAQPRQSRRHVPCVIDRVLRGLSPSYSVFRSPGRSVPDPLGRRDAAASAREEDDQDKAEETIWNDRDSQARKRARTAPWQTPFLSCIFHQYILAFQWVATQSVL
ncbi:MAG: hypothetical protein MZV63_07260 [Marinilabiliales bacterium]|nr:hypothetical protein [Marinilabiliales bacterium]